MKPKKYDIKATIYDKRGRILSTGVNSYVKSHPYQQMCANKVGLPEKSYIHAEIAAMIRIRHGIPHKIFIERYGKDGRQLTAKPCPICEHAIMLAGIKLVEYTIG